MGTSKEQVAPTKEQGVPTGGLTARRANLIACSSCHLLVKAPSRPGVKIKCPRCHGVMHRRKPNSIARTWALVIAAVVFYIPANVLPMTLITNFGKVEADTIMSGVIYFFKSGEWYIGLIIFIASIFVPILKLMILVYLLISVQRKSRRRPGDRTRLYRLIEVIGRWSMMDIYVVTVLVALVNLGALATIKAGPAALYFCAVVIITIFAAMSFDPRLIWDNMEEENA